MKLWEVYVPHEGHLRTVQVQAEYMVYMPTDTSRLYPLLGFYNEQGPRFLGQEGGCFHSGTVAVFDRFLYAIEITEDDWRHE